MSKLILEKKTGFSTILPFKIFDSKGVYFYGSDFTDKISKGLRVNFNLPFGEYEVDGNLIQLENPVNFKLVKLPPHERNFETKKYKIFFGNNPNKCTIYHDKDNPRIVFDLSFKDKPLYVKFCIYFHELGHQYYKTEKYADMYAINKALDFGFNKSQIGLAFIDSLSDRAFKRKHNVIYQLLNNKK